MNDATDPSDQRTSPPDGNQDNRPEAPELPPRPPRTTDDGWEYYKRGPRLLASIENRHWILEAEEERLAKQHKGTDTTYIHRWWIKDQCSPKTPTIAQDTQALAHTWGKALRRSRNEPQAEPVFSPDEIQFNATEDGCDDFRYPPDRAKTRRPASRPATARATRT